MRYRSIISIFALITLAISAILSITFSRSASANTSAADPKPTPAVKASKAPRTLVFIDGEFDGAKVVKKDSEWKKELSSAEFYVMRREGTEQPYTGELTDNKKAGTYHCAACGLVLFRSDAKFDSGTGWPSYFQVAFKKNVIEREDRSLGEIRTEVECARCNAHLGHVFDDGPQPTGLRYCINSVSLKFKEAE